MITSTPGISAWAGDQINVDIYINSAQGINEFQFHLNFDPTYLTMVGSVLKGDRLHDTDFISGFLDGPDKILVYTSTGTNYLEPGAGTLARITFQVAEDTPDGTVVPLIISGLLYDLSTSSISNGSVTISLDCDDNLDINGDGQVTPGDALMVLKHYLGSELLTDPCQLHKADANGDGSITPGDALLVLKAYLGI